MATTIITSVSWEERAFERSAAVQRSRERIATQVRLMLDAAQRLIVLKGDAFTTQELAAEAGVALQTFYRYFSSKDELLLAVIGDSMAEACERWKEAASELSDPLAKLRFYLMASLERLKADDSIAAPAKFVVSARWRLYRQFPKELADAEQPFVDLLREAVQDAVDAGQLNLGDATWDPWFLGELVRSVYHFYAYAERPEADIDVVSERLWQFCLSAIGGRRR
jgi:AcrR family transcriptional regulator